jgi:hypothetical protein
MKSEVFSPYKALIILLAVTTIFFVMLTFTMFSPEQEGSATIAAQAPSAAATPVLFAEPEGTRAPLQHTTTQEAHATLSVEESKEHIADILSDPTPDLDSLARNLLLLIPRLPEEAQEEAAYHIANLSSDKLAIEWMKEITEQKLPPAAAEVLFEDMLSRPQELIVPEMGRIADKANHPLQAECREILVLLFDSPVAGQTWESWVVQFLAKDNIR